MPSIDYTGLFTLLIDVKPRPGLHYELLLTLGVEGNIVCIAWPMMNFSIGPLPHHVHVVDFVDTAIRMEDAFYICDAVNDCARRLRTVILKLGTDFYRQQGV